MLAVCKTHVQCFLFLFLRKADRMLHQEPHAVNDCHYDMAFARVAQVPRTGTAKESSDLS